MKKHLLFIGFLFFANFIFSQATVTWTGGGTGDWNDGTQWDSGSEPAAGDLVVFSNSATVTGTQNNIPARVKVTGDFVVTIDLDLTIGDGTADRHGIQINNTSQINIGVDGGTGRTVTINAPTTKDGVRFNNPSDNANKTRMNVRSGSTLSIIQGRDGISTSSGTNNAARIDNNGTINISGVANNGINLAEILFENFGTISISGFGQDGIRLGQTDGSSVNAGRFDNMSTGTLNITVPAGAGSGSRAVDAYSGSTTVGRLRNFNSMNIDEGGNSTQTVGLGGGEMFNEPGATLNIGDGRIRIENNGKFINEGLFTKNSGSQSGVFIDTATGGTATNRAFFKYGNTAGSTPLFSNQGGNANGINLNDTDDTVIDAGGTMMADIANTPYEWFHDGSSLGTSDGSGILTLPTLSLQGNQTTNEPITLAEYPSITLFITNANADAYIMPLPIELISFKAKIMNKKSVMVYWETASELNNDYMAVEHSMDGVRFDEVGKVSGQGTSNEWNSYQLKHKNPQKGINYYRLRQVDFDGTIDYSEIISVYMERKTNDKPLHIYPNVTTDGKEINLDISDAEPTQVTIDIINMNGQILKSISETSGVNVLLSSNGFPNGMYIVRVTGQQFKTQIGRFIKE